MRLNALAFVLLNIVNCASADWANDLRRAGQRVPRDEYRGHGTLAGANAQLNNHLTARVGIRLKLCEQFSVLELREVLRFLLTRASTALKDIYAVDDGRFSHYSNVSEMEAHWVSNAPGDDQRVRDAHCHEAVMWFVHHLTTDSQTEAMKTIVLPTLPERDHANNIHLRGVDDKAGAFYQAKTTCQKCHVGSQDATIGTSVISDIDSPPVLPRRFHVDFKEYRKSMKPLWWQKPTVNGGSWHYDVEKKRSVWFHGEGQHDNWCQCSGLDHGDACTLINAPSAEDGGGAIYIAFKDVGRCCKLGTFQQGFGPLAQDWLRDANKTGTFQSNNRTCTTWSGGPPGDWFMMTSDDYSVDEAGLPCRYEDHFKWFAKYLLGFEHYHDFDVNTYSETEEPDDVFAVPGGMGCENDCPNTAGVWCKMR